MKKLIPALSLATYFSLVSPAFADTAEFCPAGDFSPLCNIKLSTLISPLISLIFILAVVVALIYLIYGGFKWLTSGGDKAAVQQAREHIVAAIIGLVIIFLSYFLLTILIHFFVPGFSYTAIDLPHL
jgi:hypothetical protein